MPLPAKITMKALAPIDIVEEFGEDPDIDEVDAHVRHVMQRALDELAKERRLPVLGSMGITDPHQQTLGLLSTMVRAGIIAPMRPDKYLRIAGAMQRENMAITSGFAAAAQRCPDRAGLVDELGILTWRQIDRRADAFAAALQALPDGQPEVSA